MDLSQLRALQDWFLKYELKTVPNVSEVASVGGMVRQYQIVLDPDRLRAYNIPHGKVIDAVQKANQETGGSVLELGEAEYMVRASGYLKSLDDFRQIPLTTSDAGVAVRLGDVARIQIGPEMRRGIAELNGEGEVAGGIIVMRSGKNALETIDAVKAKLEKLKASLPPGVEIVPTYDRSSLIKRAVDNLQEKLIEEFIVVALVCAVFLFHLRSAFVAIVSLPLGVLMAFIVMYYQGVNANIMSLGGIAIAIGAMVDAAVVMIENAHKHIEAWHHAHPDQKLEGDAQWRVIGDAAAQVGPALFFSLLIITLSFIPVFTLEAQEGRLFSPLAYTKTYAMAVAAGLAVTLIPVLMGYLIRGRIPEENRNPLNRFLIAIYRPVLNAVLRSPILTIALALVIAVATLWPASQIGGEFMPPLDEGDLLYMPSALPGISAGKVAELLQQTNRLIKTVPEVASVFAKAGRAETATDPAPLEMFETTIQFKPREEWRAGMTPDKLVEELDRTVKVPGLSNIWVPPIRNRIDMLATGIKSPVGVKVAGTNLQEVDRIAAEIERVVKQVPGVTSAFAERLTGGRYIDVKIDRATAGRYGLNVSDVQSVVSAAIGGDNIGETIEGLQRFPINVRYPREIRDSVETIRDLPVLTERGAQIRLRDVAAIRISDGPPMLKSENARLSGWVYVDLHGRDLSSAVRDMQRAVAQAGQGSPRLLDLVVGAVRVSRAGDPKVEDRGAGDADDHLRLALSNFPPFRRRVADHGHAALRPGRRILVDVSARLQHVDRLRRGLHRIGRRRVGDRRRDAGLRQSGDSRPNGGGKAQQPERAYRRDCRRCGAPGPSDCNDGCRDHRGAAADHVGQRHRIGGHAAHCCADGRRHDHRTAALDVRHSSGLLAHSPAKSTGYKRRRTFD